MLAGGMKNHSARGRIDTHRKRLRRKQHLQLKIANETHALLNDGRNYTNNNI
jgi:hypothetical protein